MGKAALQAIPDVLSDADTRTGRKSSSNTMKYTYLC